MSFFDFLRPCILVNFHVILALLPYVAELVNGIEGSSVGNPASPHPQDIDGPTRLGVSVVRPVYAIIPRTRDGHRNVTVVLTIWLRRVGATQGPYDMSHQSKDSIRMLVWVDSPRNLHMRVYGHLNLPTEHSHWQPRLLLETALPGPVLTAALEPTSLQYGAVWGQSPRPYSFYVELPAGTSDCFKIIEDSFPKHKASVCLPPAASDGVCDSLAPPDIFNSTKPALYTAIGPVRHSESTRDWNTHMSGVSGRLINYVSYHVAMGVTGLLQYTDVLMRSYLMQNPRIVELVRQGHLRLVKWDMPERAHDNTDGAGRPLGYNYDQALFASHALLGLSACGANLVLLVTDLDEYLYFPKPGSRWPEPWGNCMGPTNSAADSGRTQPPITVFQIQRYDLVTSNVASKDESQLWATPGTLAITGDGSGWRAVGNRDDMNQLQHPMSRYDLLSTERMNRIFVKQAQLPAARVVLFFVHEGASMIGRPQLVHHRCMALLHLPNFFRSRRNANSNGDSTMKQNRREWRPFRHWMFLEPGDAMTVSEL
ncbi:hypothetical protein Vretimale_6221 [Volvox reticuliferus]|uniref:Glycosyltransferase family 92 protein n=1 Tax=Volvox reticuliferus TaxID=1737510 RepID=A0A8J4CBM7_9CHLO|nr:hypothetical protein Vretifemale_8031 [Volvox reticuliferus]GIM01397.1 hypothetical protein Vretimale_6221 [Volvox reticuliferus]